MCHAPEATPPAPPRSQPVGETRDLHLTSADGTRFSAHLARPENPGGAGVVVFPDVRGLHDFYRAFARALAQAGFTALAVDYYGRDLPDGPRDGEMEEMMPLAARLRPEQVAADAGAATDHLRELGVDTVLTVGFCLGGSHSWLQSALGDRVAGCVGFYGSPDDCRPYLDRMRSPLLLLGAGEDVVTSRDDFHRFGKELSESGVEHESVLYGGAPHAFFDHSSDRHEQACADAWRRLLDFLDRNGARTERT